MPIEDRWIVHVDLDEPVATSGFDPGYDESRCRPGIGESVLEGAQRTTFLPRRLFQECVREDELEI